MYIYENKCRVTKFWFCYRLRSASVFGSATIFESSTSSRKYAERRHPYAHARAALCNALKCRLILSDWIGLIQTTLTKPIIGI